MATTNTIKNRIIKRISRLPKEKLESVEEFIEQIESKQPTDIMSYVGMWKHMDDEFIKDLTINLPFRRSLDKNRINERGAH